MKESCEDPNESERQRQTALSCGPDHVDLLKRAFQALEAELRWVSEWASSWPDSVFDTNSSSSSNGQDLVRVWEQRSRWFELQEESDRVFAELLRLPINPDE